MQAIISSYFDETQKKQEILE